MSLNLGYNELGVEIGYQMGYGRKTLVSQYTTSQQAGITSVMNAGLRQFYYPPILPGEDHAHEWTFLKPRAELAVVADDGDYDLPATVAGIEGPLTFSSNDFRASVEVVHESMIRKLRARDGTSTGRPNKAAIVLKDHDGSAEQLWELRLWPIPDAAYTLTYRYNVRAVALTNALPYPYGGSEHSETILASMLAVVEDRIEDAQGVRYAKFIERLRSSVHFDRQLNVSDRLGQNLDGSDGVLGGLNANPSITYRNTAYDGNP